MPVVNIGRPWHINKRTSASSSKPTGKPPTRTTTMKIFIDCEFNEFKGELISIALVAENNDVFYEAVPCANPGPWVAKHVMPILQTTPIEYRDMQFRLQQWLMNFTSVHLIADWPEDIKHFCDALIIGPGTRLNTPPLTMEIRRDLDADSDLPHNALFDAWAIKKKYFELNPKEQS